MTNGTIKISGAGGDATVKIVAFNPAEPTRDSLRGFMRRRRLRRPPPASACACARGHGAVSQRLAHEFPHSVFAPAGLLVVPRSSGRFRPRPLLGSRGLRAPRPLLQSGRQRASATPRTRPRGPARTERGGVEDVHGVAKGNAMFPLVGPRLRGTQSNWRSHW